MLQQRSASRPILPRGVPCLAGHGSRATALLLNPAIALSLLPVLAPSASKRLLYSRNVTMANNPEASYAAVVNSPGTPSQRCLPESAPTQGQPSCKDGSAPPCPQADRKRRSNLRETGNNKKGRQATSAPTSPSRMDTDVTDEEMAKILAGGCHPTSSRSARPNPSPLTPSRMKPPNGQRPPRAAPNGWPTTRPLVPVITVERPAQPSSLQELLTSVNTGSTHRVVATIHNANVLLQCYDSDDFERVKGILADRRAGFHSYTHRKARQVRLVLENAPPYMSTEHLKAALSTSGLQVAHIVRFNHRDGTPSDSLLVGFAHGTLIEDVKAVQFIDHCRISWRTFRNSKARVLQCGKCFRYNHVASNCHHTPVCPTCGHSHPSTDACHPEHYCVQCKVDGHLPGTDDCPKHRDAIARRAACIAKPAQLRKPQARSFRPDQSAFPELPKKQSRNPSPPHLPQDQRIPAPNHNKQSVRSDSTMLTSTVCSGNPPSTDHRPTWNQFHSSAPRRTSKTPLPQPTEDTTTKASQPNRDRHSSAEGLLEPTLASAEPLPTSHPKDLVRSVVATVNENPELLHPSVSPAEFLENTTIVLSALLQGTDRVELTRLVSRYMLVMFFHGYDNAY